MPDAEAKALMRVMKPIPADEIRSIDFVGCPRCNVMIHLHGVEETEIREFEEDDDVEDVEGVFCPSCDQRLFDRKGWINHLADRVAYDREVQQQLGKAAGAEQSARAA